MSEREPSGSPTDIAVPDELPVLPAQETVVYPFMVLPLGIGRERSIKLVNEAAIGNKIIAVFARRPETPEDSISPTDFFSIGTSVNMLRMLKMPDGNLQVVIQGISRVRLVEVTQTEPYLRARIEVLQDQVEEGVELEALVRSLQSSFQHAVELSPALPDEVAVAAVNIPEPGRLADFVAASINLSLTERQEVLEERNVVARLRKVSEMLSRELEILELGSKIQSQIREQTDKTQREYYLREQLRAIRKELGETDEKTAEVDELRKSIEEAHLPPEALKEAERELERLAQMPPAAPDYSIAKTYLDWMVNLPWSTTTEDRLDVAQAEEVLNQDHYDLDRVKERILDYLAVRKLKQDMRGPILCFVGPPGVGKTSLGQSIARALGRHFMRIALGGVRDEAEIRGHRRTYIGAMPGRIIQGMRRAGSNNPVFMLDEIDKVGSDFRGDPSSALLEVLDPAQNSTFVDNYLSVPFDLSRVLFITTANVLDTIPPALRDRMEIIDIPGYTEHEKLEIARRFLVPRQLEEHGLTASALQFTDAALQEIISGYTREAGVRTLERQIGTVARKVARRVAQEQVESTSVDAGDLREYLGQPRFRYEVAEQADEVGVATGLAVTPAGGDVLFVEVGVVPGRGNLTLTGQLGEVMQESARAAMTYARSRADALGVTSDFFEKHDIHVHVPAGAVPKDGPSAGITMATALISAITHRPVSKDVAMTGEITLRGKVMPIGGLKEKTLAAHRAGVSTVVFPRDNERDLEDIPEQVRHDLAFKPVQHMDEVIQVALKPEVKVEAIELATPPAG